MILYLDPPSSHIPGPVSSVRLLETLMQEGYTTLPRMRKQGCSKFSLNAAQDLLIRHGIVENAGKRGKGLQLKGIQSAEPEIAEDGIKDLILHHVTRCRTALKLSRSLGLPRSTVESVLQQCAEAGEVEQVYVGHLAIYSRT